ncbi:Hypothetical protein IALB_2783 [Ignavibacterium album JCM 16511]|uniref:DUF885 domain-containing protein n=2 Tax=Ignavibacterium album TaxID=591197 RepID=I0ANC9_IGNAJ|nr:Hypothetical protein IALB_2783 [Ignavibacterium album JCM 16511]
MNKIAEEYVKLALEIGKYDSDFIDAYYGPENWKPKSDSIAFNETIYEQLNSKVNSLLDQMEALSVYNATELEKLRYRYLYKQLLACKTKIFMLNGVTLSFDEEANALYDTEVPVHKEEFFKNSISELDKLLPGNGTISERLQKFKERFKIPEDKLKSVFDAAITECRKRTLKNIQLPPTENFTVEYVKNKPWGAYNWYKGNFYSVIQVNTDLPIYIDRAIDLAAHEGYPGHHVYNVLLEWNLYRKKEWVEFSVYVLFSPQSLIAEGTANYGIEVAFPGDERIKFEKEILFPLAGLDAGEAALYYKVLDLLDNLSYAGNEAARNFLNGKWNEQQTIDWLMKYNLRSKESAAKYLDFIKKYRSYVINYNVGLDLVKNYIERSGGTEDNPVKRWELFKHLLSTPQTPGGLSSDTLH